MFIANVYMSDTESATDSEEETLTISASEEASSEEEEEDIIRPTRVIQVVQAQPVYQQAQPARVNWVSGPVAPSRPTPIAIRPSSIPAQPVQSVLQPVQPLQPLQPIQPAVAQPIRILTQPVVTQPTQVVVQPPQPTVVQVALPQETIAQLLHKLPGINITPLSFDPNQPVDIGAILIRDPQIESAIEYSAREQLTLQLIQSELQLNNLTAVVVGLLMMNKLRSGVKYTPDVEQILEQMNKVLTQPGAQAPSQAASQ